MKIKFTFLLLFSFIFLSGNMMVKAQSVEVWNQTPDWNTAKNYRGIAYNSLNNHLYVVGTEGDHTIAGEADKNKINVLNATSGELISTLTLEPLTLNSNGYGLRDVEVSSDGGIFATITTTNNFNPIKIYYWANENADPVLLWNDVSGDDIDSGPGFSVFGDFTKEALIIIPHYDVAKVYYFEVSNGMIAEPVTLDLTGVSGGTTPTVQALGTKILDGFWYNNATLQKPTLMDGTGNVIGAIDATIFTGTTSDIKQFTAGASKYLAVSNDGAVQVINITAANADFSNITATEIMETIPGIAPVAPGWPSEYGYGQEQAVIGNPDGSYAVYSFSGGNYIKAYATEGAPFAVNAKLSGSPMVGEVKTAEYTYVDLNGDAEATSEIKWFMADDAMGTNIAEITANAGQSTYTLDAADAGKFISFTLLPVAATGTISDLLHFTTSMVFGPVLTEMHPPVAADAAIAGLAKVGETLTATYTYSDPDSDLEGNSIYEWFRADDTDGTNTIKVASGSLAYIATGDDAGKYIIFSVTPVAASGFLTEGEAITTMTDATVLFPPLPPTAEDVTINGRIQVAATLTASYTFVDLNEDLEGASIIKWYRADDAEGLTNKVEIATDVMTYKLVAEDLGKYIIFEVTPVTEADETGDLQSYTTEMIEAEPDPVAPVASDVVLAGTPEVDAILSVTYTYSDDIDDPEGASIMKWYTADDAAGTNKAEIAGATGQTYLVTEADLGKFFAFEVTPVAISGGLLVGEPILSNYTAAGAVASSNTFGIERLWLASTKTGAAPYYLNPAATTERGFAIGEDYIYIASRYGETKIVAIDKNDGSFVKELSVEGISGGIFPINDIELSDDGQILAAPLNDAPEFWIYKWENELADPVKWLSVELTESMRFGDKFSVTGDVSGDAIIMAARTGSNQILRWVITGGVPGEAEILTLNGLGSMETSPAVVPFSVSVDANLLIDGKGLAPRIFDKDLNEVGSVAKIDDYAAYKIQSNSPNVFQYKGRTMAAFFQAIRQEPLGARIIIADITSKPYQIVDSSEYVSNSMPWDGYLGEVDVTTDGEYYYAYMLQAKNAVAAYRGKLELPMFVSAITAFEGNKIMAEFDMTIKEIDRTNAENWTITAGGNAVVIDTIYSDGTTINFDLTTVVTEGQAIMLSYDGNAGISSFNAMPLAAFGPESVENIVGAEIPVATEVSITGDANPTSVLTGVYTFADPDGDAEGTSMYQWYEATDASGSNMLKLLGEKSATYTIVADLIGKFVAFEVIPVSATGGDDYLVGEAVKSAFIPVIGVGVGINTLDHVTVYPNPVTDVLTINNSGSIESLSLVDVTGKVLMSMNNLSENQIRLNMNNIKAGVYYLKLSGDNGQIKVHSIIKTQ